MMNHKLLRFATFAALLAFCNPGFGAEEKKTKTFREQLADKMTTCEYSFEVIMDKPETAIPAQILKEARGIIIVHQIRVGLIFGGQGGTAVLLCRLPQNEDRWGPPVFLDPGGFNFGLQAGGQEINSVFILNSEDAVRRAYSGRFDIGADASAIAGPRNADVDNFDLFKAPVLVYTSLGGLYAGATLKTGWLKPYHKGNRELYNTSFSTPEIALSTWFEIPSEAQSILDRVRAAEQGATQ